MKLYFWPSLQSLRNYSTGKAIAMANSREEAAAAVVANYLTEHPPFDPEDEEDYNVQRLALLRHELSVVEPEEHDEPCGFALFGSE